MATPSPLGEAEEKDSLFSDKSEGNILILISVL